MEETEQAGVRVLPNGQGASGWEHVRWVLGAASLGLGVAAIFSGWLRLPRDLFLLIYVTISGTFLYAYFRWSSISIHEALLKRWAWGVLGAVASGALVVANVLSQPSSPTPQGPALAWALLWWGVIYGIVDALLLSILPVMATWEACSLWGWTRTVPGRIAAGTLALLASLVVTAAYHFGYPEFRGPMLQGPLIGNAVLTLAYLLTGSPLAPIGGHVAMHIAAVLHGPGSAIQLPPHY
jgi:hypothetical protein